MQVEIDDVKKAIFEEIKNNPDKNYFIQGGAGTGKSTLINYIRKHFGRKLAVVAPTGIAADLINGVTIHSLFKLGGRPYFPLNLVEKYKNYDDIVELIDTLIIDEVSMLRADILDTINILCQKAKKNQKVFGGIQLILVGDLYQLPPVYRYDVQQYDNKQIKKEKIDARDYMNETYGCLQPFFFDALCYQEANFQKRELTTCYRQNDEKFLKNLNIIRENNNNGIADALNYFNNCDENNTDTPIVTSTRELAEKKNDEEFAKIKTEEKIFIGKFDGDYYTCGDEKILQQRKRDVQVPEFLHLKKTAKVMICKNDPDGQYVNGTIGEISDFGKISEDGVLVDVIKVKIQNTKQVVEIKKSTWQIQEYVKNNKNELELKNIGSYTQFPIKLAYAITIHKSQGQTWDGICIDLGKNAAFADGQVYVALSRVKTKEGIHLKRKLLATDVKVNPRIEEFLKSEKSSAPLTDELICPSEDAKIISDIDNINQKIANNKNTTTINKKEHFSASKVESDVKKLKNVIFKELKKLQNKYGFTEENNEQGEIIKRLKTQNEELKKELSDLKDEYEEKLNLIKEENNLLREKLLSFQREKDEPQSFIEDKKPQISTSISFPKKEFFINGKECSSNEFASYLWDCERDVKRTIYYGDNTSITNIWYVRKFTRNSNLDFNINTGPLKYWKAKNIIGIKFELEI